MVLWREVGVLLWELVRMRRVVVHCRRTGSSSSASARCLMLGKEEVSTKFS